MPRQQARSRTAGQDYVVCRVKGCPEYGQRRYGDTLGQHYMDVHYVPPNQQQPGHITVRGVRQPPTTGAA